jgi:hypothetical protein
MPTGICGITFEVPAKSNPKVQRGTFGIIRHRACPTKMKPISDSSVLHVRYNEICARVADLLGFEDFVQSRLAAMLRYKQLRTVEETFRAAKHLLATQPIFRKLDETIRGHVFCSFLALVLKAELEARIAALGNTGSSPISMH